MPTQGRKGSKRVEIAQVVRVEKVEKPIGFDISTPLRPQTADTAMAVELPADIKRFAEATRAAFGPGVKLLRVLGDDGLQIGNARWDELLNAVTVVSGKQRA